MEENPRPNCSTSDAKEEEGVLPIPKKNDNTTQVSVAEQELMRSHLECTICKGVFLKPIHLSCGHDFCQPCLRKWKKNCAICRKSIDLELTSSTKCLESLADGYFRTTSTKDEIESREFLIQKENEREKEHRSLVNSESSSSDDDNSSETSVDSDLARRFDQLVDEAIETDDDLDGPESDSTTVGNELSENEGNNNVTVFQSLPQVDVESVQEPREEQCNDDNHNDQQPSQEHSSDIPSRLTIDDYAHLMEETDDNHLIFHPFDPVEEYDEEYINNVIEHGIPNEEYIKNVFEQGIRNEVYVEEYIKNVIEQGIIFHDEEYIQNLIHEHQSDDEESDDEQYNQEFQPFTPPDSVKLPFSPSEPPTPLHNTSLVDMVPPPQYPLEAPPSHGSSITLPYSPLSLPPLTPKDTHGMTPFSPMDAHQTTPVKETNNSNSRDFRNRLVQASNSNDSCDDEEAYREWISGNEENLVKFLKQYDNENSSQTEDKSADIEGSNNEETTGRRRRSSLRFTTDQLSILEAVYKNNQAPKKIEEWSTLCGLTNLTLTQVRSWFYRRRKKEKKKEDKLREKIKKMSHQQTHSTFGNMNEFLNEETKSSNSNLALKAQPFKVPHPPTVSTGHTNRSTQPLAYQYGISQNVHHNRLNENTMLPNFQNLYRSLNDGFPPPTNLTSGTIIPSSTCDESTTSDDSISNNTNTTIN